MTDGTTPTIDSALSPTSENPVQNKVVTTEKADIITDTASGTIATFPDGAPYPVKDLQITIEPVQSGSGDPSPDNVRPISGWTGANIMVSEVAPDEKIITFKPRQSGSGTPSPTNKRPFTTINVTGLNPIYGGTINTKTKEFSRDYIAITMKGQSWYDSSGTYPAFACSKAAYAVNGEINSYCTCYEVIGTMSGANFRAANHNKKMVHTASNILIQDSNYNNATAFNDSLGNTDMIVYKTTTPSVVTLTDSQFAELMAAIGVNTVNVSWQSEAGTVYGGKLNVETGVLMAYPYYASYSGETLVGPWVSSMDKYVAGTTPTTGAQVVDFGGTPTIYQLTAEQLSTLYGQNNIFADCGDVAVTYRADTQLYIQKLTGSTEEDMIANVNIAANKYFMVGGNLYYSTTAIAAGASIVPGTNCTATNLADALNALNA